MAKIEALLEQASVRLQSEQHVIVVSHIRPDGDAIGSLLGLGLALQTMGKQVQMVSPDGIPAHFRHLEGSSQVLTKPVEEFDCSCVLDTSDLERVGDVFEKGFLPDLNIDHHVTNLNFARINIIDVQAVSTTEILFFLLGHMGISFTKPIASALLTGLITDTIGFRTSSMSPRALRMAADLMEAGVDLPELYRKALINRSFEAARYWGFGLTRLQREGRLAWTSLTLDDRNAVGYPGRDDADLSNVLSAMNDIDISLIFVEQPGGKVKVSWRAQPGFDVSGIARCFGGGGHPAASGAEVQGSMNQVQEMVLKETRSLLNNKDYHQVEG